MHVQYIEALLREASEAHHAYEAKTGKPDDNWVNWYAQHMADAIARDGNAGVFDNVEAHKLFVASRAKTVAENTERTAKFTPMTREERRKSWPKNERPGRSDKHDL